MSEVYLKFELGLIANLFKCFLAIAFSQISEAYSSPRQEIMDVFYLVIFR